MPRRSEKRESRSGRGEPGAILTAALANETVNPETETTEQPVPAEQLDDSTFWTTGPEGELVPNYDATFPTINEGEVVHGTVVRVDKDEVLVDIGYKSEGVIPVAELSIRRSINPEDEVAVGDEIDALVLEKEDAEGRLKLEEARALRARLETDRGRSRERRARRGQGDRGRQGRPDPRPRR